MPWPVALLLAVWVTELLVMAAAVSWCWLGNPWDLMPGKDPAWSEDDEADWQELLQRQDAEWGRR